MISSPFFLLSILSSAFFAFFTAAFAVEIAMKIFRITHHRIRSMARLLPFISLLSDLFFNRYSIAHWINPLSCESCVQKFFLDIFFPQLKAQLAQNEISLVNYLAIDRGHSFFTAIFILFATFTFLVGLHKLVKVFLLIRYLRTVVKNGFLWDRPVENVQLAQKLQQDNVKIYISDEIQIPLATFSKAIVIPRGLIEKLTTQEFEAVVAHELEHVKFQDPLARLLYQFTATIFWWVPTHAWIKKLEQDQEMACDQSVLKYGLEGESLASALVKVTRQVKCNQALCYLASGRKTTLVRMEKILGLSPIDESIFGLNFLGVAAGTLLLLVCVIWL